MDRFWSKVQVGPELSCWEWQAFRHPVWKYGRILWEGKVWQAHRVAYTLTHGPIPVGLLVRHSCDNPPCCNPAHLLLGRDKQNSEDRESRNRGNQPAGEDNGEAKLIESEVRKMRSLRAKGLYIKEIATMFDMSYTQTRRILIGESWSHITSRKEG